MKALFARSAIGLVRDCMVVLAIFIALTGSAMAENKVQTSIKFLSLITGGSAPTSLKVSGKTILLLPFTWTLPRDGPKTFEIYVTPFREQEQGNYLTIEPSIEEQPKNKAKGQRLTINLKQSLLTLRLKVPELPTAGKYDGQIVVFHQGKVVRSATILLSRAKVVKSVKLVIDRPAITVTESPWTLFTGNSPSFTVTIRNESPDWKAKGVYLRLIEVTGPDYANFDQTKNLQLTWNGRATDDLWRSPSPEAVLAGSVRTIAPGQQAIFTGTYRGLAAGTYNIKIGVASADQAKEQKTEVTVTLRIRDSVFWALIVLAVAIVLSYFSTKGLITQRKRVNLLKKISDIRPPWLREEPATLPVVSVRAILKQAEMRNKRWSGSLFAPEIMSGRVERAAQMLGPIGRVRQIRQRIKKWDQDQMIRNRAEKRLRGIVAGLNPETVDDKQVTAIETRLDELENWFNSDNLYELYWADLKGDVNTLLTQVDPKAFTEQNQTAVVQGRIDEINKQVQAINNQQSAQSSAQQGAQSSAQQKSNLKDYIKIEWEYAKLKILWERKLEGDGDALGQLCKLIEEKPDITIDAFFQKADDIAWNLLKDACTKENEGQRGLEFISPRRSSIQPLEAYQLIHFEVAPKVRKLANNYLFKHGLEYRWTLKIQSEKEKNNGRPILLTSDRSEEPRIVQFVPKKGKLHVSVELCRNGDCAEAVSLDEPLLIAASRDFGYRSAFRFGEVMAFSLAALLATVSGLGTFYFDEPVFGSVKNYIALFLWGAGVDQTKNFIQNLERVSPQS